MTEDAKGDRFEFGKNWKRFLTLLSEERICEAENSLKKMLGTETLDGKTFLDIGCGSGLFSLAARRLGARVRSFDYDQVSVECAMELKKRFFPADSHWMIDRGDILDENYLRSLGTFDVVYAWGVLHHTGAMWQALENVAPKVREGGKLFISIYNYQGKTSRFWRVLKRRYVHSSKPLKLILVLGVGIYFEIRLLVARLMRRQNPLPFGEWRNRKKSRGMSVWHDLVDWVGGYPFEVAKPEEIFDFYFKKGFQLLGLKTCGGGRGCNEFVFIKENRIKKSCSVGKEM